MSGCDMEALNSAGIKCQQHPMTSVYFCKLLLHILTNRFVIIYVSTSLQQSGQERRAWYDDIKGKLDHNHQCREHSNQYTI